MTIILPALIIKTIAQLIMNQYTYRSVSSSHSCVHKRRLASAVSLSDITAVADQHLQSFTMVAVRSCMD